MSKSAIHIISYPIIFGIGAGAVYHANWIVHPFSEVAKSERQYGEFVSFISLMLTGVTVVLAALAIFIGIVAFYTYHGIRDEAKKIAEVESKSISKEVSESVAKITAEQKLSKQNLMLLIEEALKEKIDNDETAEDDPEDFDR